MSMNYRLAATHCTHHTGAAEQSTAHVRKGQRSVELNRSTRCGVAQHAQSLLCGCVITTISVLFKKMIEKSRLQVVC